MYNASMSDRNVVYSTDGGRQDRCPGCGRPREACRCAGRAAPAGGRGPTRDPADGIVRLHRDRKGRGGKTVTLITGVRANPAALEELATTLKRSCGCGGAVKGDVIEIQGDHRERLAAKLADLGYSVKLAGG
jgi:translation initiation factor 1